MKSSLFSHSEASDDCIILWDSSDFQSIYRDGEPILHLAIRTREFRLERLDLVQLLIDFGAGPNQKSQGGCNALHAASHEGRLEVVKILVPRVVNIDDVDNRGYTAMTYAARGGHIDIMKWLFEQGNADIHKTSSDQTSPLHFAA